MDRKDQQIKAAIGRLSSDEATAFSQIFERMMDAAFTYPLWGAAYVVNGGCGDDSFMDFRASLISRGQVAFDKAVLDPDSLADEDIDIDSWFHEGFQYAIMDGVEAKTGSRLRRVSPPPSTPAGQKWAEATVRDLYPRLVRRLELHR